MSQNMRSIRMVAQPHRASAMRAFLISAELCTECVIRCGRLCVCTHNVGGAMGLFDKKVKKAGDDFDSPVEQVSLSAAPPVAPKPAAEPEPHPARPAPMDVDHPDYGINKAIELMRALPSENVELVVRVVKTTLESTNIKVASIIKDATRKQGELEGRVGVLKKEIAELEAEITTRRREISTLEADHKETTMVKDRLQLAEKLASGQTAEPALPPQRPVTGSFSTRPSTQPPATAASGGGIPMG